MAPTTVFQEERRFLCPHGGCNKAFSRRDYLQRHSANHSDVKPFQCHCCSTRYARKDILEKHQRTRAHIRRTELQTSQTPPKSSETLPIPIETTIVNQIAEEPVPVFAETLPLPQQPHPQPLFDRPESGFASEFFDNYEWLFGSDPSGTSIQAQYDSPTDSTPSSLRSDRSDLTHTALGLDPVTLAGLRRFINIECFDDVSDESANEYFGLFWSRFGSVYPIVHHGTFEPHSADPFLLANMLTIGMMYAGTAAEKDCGIAVQKKLRRLQLAEIDDTVEIRFSLLQSFLLTAFFALYLGDCDQSKVGQLFHGTNVSLVRFSGSFQQLVEPKLQPPLTVSPEEARLQWYRYIDYESRKRTAFFAYFYDAQNAAVTRTQPSLSAFEIHLELPCTDAVWNAESPVRFYQEYERQPHDLRSRVKFTTMHRRPSREHLERTITLGGSSDSIPAEGKWPNFLFSLRRLMQPYRHHQKEYPMNCFSQFSRFIFLHGIIGICLDLRWRGLFDLGIVSQRRMVEFSERLETAFFNWRDYFDRQIMITNNQGHLRDYETDKFLLNDYGVSHIFWANLTALQLGLLLLHADNDLITKHAELFALRGATNSSQLAQRVAGWARSRDGVAASADACQVLRTVLNNEPIIETIAHVPFVLVFATLCAWTFEFYRDDFGPLANNGSVSMRPYHSDKGLLEYACRESALKYVSEVEAVDETDSQPFWRRRQRALGLVAYSLTMLRRFTHRNMELEIGLLEGILTRYG
ncbi:unnamed protein product [Kuraishia capsulata CBS 1993]|uniref:C2H2-type domain-containing protein n=1 Tax=Kuraishia capsulata CBS 1993 TaxID=1382522 RepID=W6MIU3_9ASCO|nr:uncharacterized protein KUCA_T00001829001 [Kuraishia capsulata CBS 1993]CDK25858.1 unnamed protein product [Kuraishia capsulata CBS 1993]